MKTIFFSLFILCFYFGRSSFLLNDSLIKKNNRYIEIKSSKVLFFQGKSGEADNNDKVFGVPSENFNLAIGKKFNSFFSCGINLDYSKFNATGQAKLAGWDSDTKVNITKYRFLIRQNVQISHLSFGFTPNYNYRYRKFIIDLGVGVYFTLYRSIKIINHYEGDQTNYYSSNPAEGVKIIDDENNASRHWSIPYLGPTLNLGYQVNKHFGVRFSSAFYYTYMENILGNTYGYYTLPKHSIYTIRKETWLTSGISIMFNY